MAEHRGFVPGAASTVATGLVKGQMVYVAPRCHACGKQVMLYVAPPYAFYCPRCKAENRSG